MAVIRRSGPRYRSPEWCRTQYRPLIRAAYTHAELDRARLTEEAMLPRDECDKGQDDVRETPTRMDPWCSDDLVGYLVGGPDAETGQEQAHG